MNDLEKSTYCEPDFSIANEIISETEEKENKKNKNDDLHPMDDDEIAHLAECF